MSEDGRFTRRELAGAGAVGIAGAYGFYKGIQALGNPRKAEDQLLIPYIESIKLTPAENDLRLELFRSVNENRPELAVEKLNAMPDTERSLEIAAHPFKKAVEEGRIEVMQAFAEKFPRLTNAMYSESFDRTPMEMALVKNNTDMIKALRAKGAKFELTSHPQNFVSHAAYYADMDLLRFLDSEKFSFPQNMKGYEQGSFSFDSPFCNLVYGAMWEGNSAQERKAVTDFLLKKGYDPKGAAEYAQKKYDVIQDAINKGLDPSHRLENIFRPRPSALSAKEAQENIAELRDYFKKIEQERSKPKGPIASNSYAEGVASRRNFLGFGGRA